MQSCLSVHQIACSVEQRGSKSKSTSKIVLLCKIEEISPIDGDSNVSHFYRDNNRVPVVHSNRKFQGCCYLMLATFARTEHPSDSKYPPAIRIPPPCILNI